VITSGFFSIDSGDPARFQFTGDDFDIIANFLNVTPTGMPGPGNFAGGIGPFETCFRCAPGAAVDLSSRAAGPIGEWVNGGTPVRFQGSEFRTVFFSGNLTFDAPTVTAPGLGVNFQEHHLIAPFLFTGDLTAFATPQRTGQALFAVALTGRGDVDVDLEQAGSEFSLLDVDYRFSSATAAPTPEPATLLLLGGALLSACAMRRHRTRSSLDAAASVVSTHQGVTR
jgi:hypothetical protein